MHKSAAEIQFRLNTTGPSDPGVGVAGYPAAGKRPYSAESQR